MLNRSIEALKASIQTVVHRYVGTRTVWRRWDERQGNSFSPAIAGFLQGITCESEVEKRFEHACAAGSSHTTVKNIVYVHPLRPLQCQEMRPSQLQKVRKRPCVSQSQAPTSSEAVQAATLSSSAEVLLVKDLWMSRRHSLLPSCSTVHWPASVSLAPREGNRTQARMSNKMQHGEP